MLGAWLAAVEVGVVVVSLGCMRAGWRAIRRHDTDAHRRWMLAALGSQVLFAALFISRLVLLGLLSLELTDDPREGVLFALVVAHEAPAVVTVPLVLATATLALRGRFAAHADLARSALPVWVYTSVTGIVVYVLLFTAL